MALKIRIQLSNVMIIDVTSTVRGKLKITVPSLGLQKEFSFEVKDYNRTNPAITIFNGQVKYADSITSKVAIWALRHGMSPQMHIATLGMLGVTSYFQDHIHKSILIPPPNLIPETKTALQEALR